EESKSEDVANVKDTAYPGKEDGLDSLSFMAWAKATLMTFSEDMLIRRTRMFPQRHEKGPSHRKDNNLNAEKGKGRSKQKEQKAHHIGQRYQQLKKLTSGFKQKMREPEKERLALGREHTHQPTLSRIRAPVDSETAIVVNRSKAREKEVSDAKGNSSMKASVVITRSSCLIDLPSIIQSRKQSQRPSKKDDFYFKILSWIVKKPKGKKEEQKQRRCLLYRPLTIYPWSLSLCQRESLFLKQARRYQEKIPAEAEKEEEKEERTATITSLDELQLRLVVNEGIESPSKGSTTEFQDYETKSWD
nr:proteasome subunit alpha type-1 [Tanacetum cinerariifolium]